MNAEVFADWLKGQGHHILRTQSSFWFDAGPKVYQAFPYHWLINPSDEEINSILIRNNAVALRFSSPVESPKGCISYHAVYRNPNYSLDMLDRRSRQNVRTGLNRCHVKPISMKLLAEEGWGLETDTARRQGRKLRINRERWRRRHDLAGTLEGFTAWGALVDNRLVASLFALEVGDCCLFLSQQCHGEFLSKRVNNALIFIATQTMINRPGIHSIFYSLQSLDASPSVDEFKFRMGYEAVPVRQRVVFHPWVAPLVHPAITVAVQKLSKRMSGYPIVSKLAGMMHIYQEGRNPLHRQTWPSCLRQAESMKTIHS